MQPEKKASHNEHAHHIMPVGTYLAVFVALIVLLFLTVGAAFLDFGAFNKVITIAIAVTKALLIMSFFMHLRHSSKLVWIFAGMGFFWLLFILLITLGDYWARDGVIPSAFLGG